MSPKYVYKYRTFTKNHLQAMLENNVWFSVSSEFNDPFDSSIFLLSEETSASTILNDMRNDDPRRYERIVQCAKLKRISPIDYLADHVFKNGIEMNLELDAIINTNLTRAYIFSTCLTFGNVPMWSHYGDCHKGFCVSYNLEKLLKTCSEKVRYHAPVTYVKQGIDPLFLLGKGDDDFLKIDQVIGTKSELFELEKEYRFVLSEIQRLPDEKDMTEGRYKPNSIPVIHDREAIDSIYFGMKTRLSDKQILQKLLSDSPHIKYFDLKAENNFRLIEEPTDF